jgi:hypothetical protein
MMSAAGLRVWICLVGLLVLASCGGAPPDSTPRGSAVDAPATVPMALRSSVSLEARLNGILALENGCVVIRSEESAWAVVWPSPGTTWEPAQLAVAVDGVTARVGDEVVLNGGETTIPGDPGVYDWVSRPTPSCIRQPNAWVASSMSVVERAP